MSAGHGKLDHPEDAIIVVRKKGGGHGGHHGGAWKVAYADFVTAMMALFIVLWIVGQSQKVKAAVAGYFKDPSAVPGAQAAGAGAGPGTAGTPAPFAPPLPAEPAAATEPTRVDPERQQLERAAQALADALASRPDLARLASQVTIEVTHEGLRMELRETSETAFFDVGTANLKGEARAVLGLIAGEVAKLHNNVVVEGHTDSRRYASAATGYTNFELSAERANSARRFLVAGGLPPGQVSEVRGYADSRPRNRDNPLDPANRRISILVRAGG